VVIVPLSGTPPKKSRLEISEFISLDFSAKDFPRGGE